MFIFFPLALLVELYNFIVEGYTTIFDPFGFIWPVIFFIVLPGALFWGHFKLVNNGYLNINFIKMKKDFELNRQTGMVTLYKSNRTKHFSHPFIEFDAILASAPSHQGLLRYTLYLVHRYNNYSFGIPLSGLMAGDLQTAEYKRLWNMIQQYMDTSRPMPDVLMLEAFRELDPITAEYDKTHPRDSHYWRNMSDEVFTETLAKIQKEQKDLPLSGESINIYSE